MPPELLPPATGKEPEGPGAPEVGVPPALQGYEFRPGRRGPRTSLRPEMIEVIAQWVARTGIKRVAAAKAGTTEDCLDSWLKRGLDASRRRKASLYTELLAAVEAAWAHRAGYLVELGERTVTDRHMNPRFVTWLLAVTSPKHFTVPKEGGQAGGAARSLGPAFEMVSPSDAARSLEEKLAHFLATEVKVERILAEGAAAAQAETAGGGTTGPG
jgi:hypothetical protein